MYEKCGLLADFEGIWQELAGKICPVGAKNTISIY
jgi:hypothetical protein